MLHINTSNPYFVHYMNKSVGASLDESIRIWQSPATLGVKLGETSGIVKDLIPFLVRVYFQYPYPDLRQWFTLQMTDEYRKGWNAAERNTCHNNMPLPAWLGWVDGSVTQLSIPHCPQFYWNTYMSEVFVHDMNNTYH